MMPGGPSKDIISLIIHLKGGKGDEEAVIVKKGERRETLLLSPI
jgi:hypothetical protein